MKNSYIAFIMICCIISGKIQGSHGDADAEAGLRQWWQIYNALPASEKPLLMYSYSEEEATFLQKALEYSKKDL
jgi:hypothetical protein